MRLISGQHLPNVSSRQAGEIIEPYVKIRVNGHSSDFSDWCSNVVPKNGFNPYWNDKASFLIFHPEIAIVEFKVIR